VRKNAWPGKEEVLGKKKGKSGPGALGWRKQRRISSPWKEKDRNGTRGSLSQEVHRLSIRNEDISFLRCWKEQSYVDGEPHFVRRNKGKKASHRGIRESFRDIGRAMNAFSIAAGKRGGSSRRNLVKKAKISSSKRERNSPGGEEGGNLLM